jgi:hypothetical protein
VDNFEHPKFDSTMSYICKKTMSSKFGIQKGQRHQPKLNQPILSPESVSFLDVMEDGREFESIIKLKKVNVDLVGEIKRALKDIENIRGRPNIAYMANVVNNGIKAVRSIDYSDDLPFSELVNTVPASVKELDIILVTPGGSGQQTAKFVDKLRPRFENVTFILPNISMSAGTIFALSGDDTIMTNSSYIGPIDPQVPNKDGAYVAAQSIGTLLEEIRTRGAKAIAQKQSPDWMDLQMLKNLDLKEWGNAINLSRYSIELLENYLHDYKFKSWTHHTTTGIGVTPEEKRARANEIAIQLCDNSIWKTHGRGITREVAWQGCKLKITHSESIEGLDRAIKRAWAIFYWLFENTSVYKTFVSQNYSLMRNDRSAIKETGHQ